MGLNTIKTPRQDSKEQQITICENVGNKTVANVQMKLYVRGRL